MVTIIFYLYLGPKYEYEYVAYDKLGETQWECDDQVWGEIDGKDYKDYAIEICNDNPSCRYIGVKEMKIPGGKMACKIQIALPQLFYKRKEVHMKILDTKNSM